MHPLTTFYKVSYNIIDTGLYVKNPVSGIDKYGIKHFYNDTEFFSEFFKVVVTPESDVLDIGVNFGLHTDMYLNLTKGNIYAFDASPGIFPITKNKYKNQKNVRLYNVAVTDFDGFVEFLDTEDLGAGSVKLTKANINTKINTHEVKAIKLDSIDDLAQSKEISCIKLDIEGAEISAIMGALKLINKHRPYMVMEWAHTMDSFTYKGKQIVPFTLKELCDDIDYIPFNIYGICLADNDVFETSIFKDTYDVILVPKEKLAEWCTTKLPKYQYAIFDKICGQIENFEPFPGYYLLTSLPRRIYDIVNNKSRPDSLYFLSRCHNNLRTVLKDKSVIFEIDTLWARGRVLLALIYKGDLQNAYDLSIIKNCEDKTLRKYNELLNSN